MAFVQSLGLRRIVDKHCPYSGALAHGLVFTILVLNRLHSPRPLYHVADWAAHVGLLRLLHINGAALNDDRLAETLEAVYSRRRTANYGGQYDNSPPAPQDLLLHIWPR